MENRYYPFVNTPLPYGYAALEPFIDEKTMHLHHDRHLQTYIDNLNAVLRGQPQLQQLSLEQLIQASGRLPTRLRDPIRRNAGGVYNHRFFFNGMAPASGGEPYGRLGDRLRRQFGSIDRFWMAFNREAMAVFGSGYAWLVRDRDRLKILSTPNQDSPVEQGYCPILTVDVWEHAYYLKHYNRRADYLTDFRPVVNWDQAEQNFMRCPPSSRG